MGVLPPKRTNSTKGRFKTLDDVTKCLVLDILLLLYAICAKSGGPSKSKQQRMTLRWSAMRNITAPGADSSAYLFNLVD